MSNNKGRTTLKCPECDEFFSNPKAFVSHVRSHRNTTRRHPPPPSPPSKLMSQRSFRDDSLGVFDFASVLDNERRDSDFTVEYDSEVDSYYSDAVYHFDNFDGDSEDDDSFDIDVGSVEEYADDDVFDYVDSSADDDTVDDHAEDNNNNIPQYWEVPYFTPRTVPDEEIPYSEDVFSPICDFNPPSSFVMQIKLQQLFNKNRASLKMYDDMISIINTYIESPDFSPHTKLQTRNTFLNRVEEVFQTVSFKPTYGSVVLHNNSIATVPVFDMKTMIEC